MEKDELLTGLAASLPAAIDKLTPDGRVPTEEELDRMDVTLASLEDSDRDQQGPAQRTS